MSGSSMPLFATIDLGSNSFHMLIVQHDPDEPDLTQAKIVTKIKRKVRLASGLGKDGILNDDAFKRGLDCLNWFAQNLAEIKPQHCIIAATATLRLAKNAKDFVAQGEAILGHPIQIISGEQEANYIYQGASNGHQNHDKKLVIDIGGASTELILGHGNKATKLTSLNVGCVTWLEQFFGDKKITQSRFELAISATKKELAPIKTAYIEHGWLSCFGASGTIQAIKEILLAQGREFSINMNVLQELKQQLIDCKHIKKINIEGLTPERAIVFPSGIAILIAIVSELSVESVQLANGALREGLLFSLINANE